MAKQRLGRGLEALIPTPEIVESPGGALPNVSVGLIDPNPLQPRKDAFLQNLTLDRRAVGACAFVFFPQSIRRSSLL